ncbi:methyltransferase domain-containing protein [Aridibaculum aurantiacum]|uniref:methyltransferase domain-containing protein n=1 Tax=Aridibaculum aurantiacum TaxID=2810307 RepID=UPI001A971244|nr:methyltransferase domain-containing protein [Aridibaculum aurantiacum]
MHKDAIKKYYSDTQFEYKLIWNWMLKSTPALHFGYYDEKATNHKQAIVRANEVLAEFAGIQKGARIVDAGCGLGHSSEWLAKNLDATVTGISIVEKQVATIHQRLAKHPVPKVDFVVADYLEMPFEDNSLDVVWAFESVCHAASKQEFYKEAARVLKPGGKVVMAEYTRTSRPMETDKEQLLHQVFDPWAIPDLDTIQEHQQHALATGFSSFNCKDITPHVMKSYRNLRDTCRRYATLSKLLYNTGVISSVRHGNMLSSLKQADAIEQGVFTYHHIVAEKG